MGYGYSLLPTVDDPVSNMTFRLTPAEKRERDEWILGAHERKMPLEEIAFEVGLSKQRVHQIIKQGSPGLTPSMAGSVSVGPKKKFNTPRDAAMDDFYKNQLCRHCARHSDLCNDCFGRSMITESEYDKDGQPYSWALDQGQIKFLEQAEVVTVNTDVITFNILEETHVLGFRDGGIGWAHSHSLCSDKCDCFPECQSENFIVFRQGPKHRPGAKTYLI